MKLGMLPFAWFSFWGLNISLSSLSAEERKFSLLDPTGHQYPTPLLKTGCFNEQQWMPGREPVTLVTKSQTLGKENALWQTYPYTETRQKWGDRAEDNGIRHRKNSTWHRDSNNNNSSSSSNSNNNRLYYALGIVLSAWCKWLHFNIENKSMRMKYY